jgi:hypothetical protein
MAWKIVMKEAAADDKIASCNIGMLIKWYKMFAEIYRSIHILVYWSMECLN